MHRSVGSEDFATVRLRAKNQLTMPAEVLKHVGAAEGDRFLVTTEDGGIRLQPIRASYAGAMEAVFPHGAADEIRAERDAWRE